MFDWFSVLCGLQAHWRGFKQRKDFNNRKQYLNDHSEDAVKVTAASPSRCFNMDAFIQGVSDSFMGWLVYLYLYTEEYISHTYDQNKLRHCLNSIPNKWNSFLAIFIFGEVLFPVHKIWCTLCCVVNLDLDSGLNLSFFKIQAMVRMHQARKKYKDRLKYFKDHVSVSNQYFI